MATVELITKNAQGGLEKRAVGLPVGMIFWTAAKTPPPHSLAADGAAVSRMIYAELFAAIGTTWGEGDGSITFTLPDARWRTVWGGESAFVGTYYSAGLPNISGSVLLTVSGAIGGIVQYCYECFSGEQETQGFDASLSNTPRHKRLVFNASRSSSIYGASSTVQPPALCLLPCIVYE